MASVEFLIEAAENHRPYLNVFAFKFFDFWFNGTPPHPNVNVGPLSRLADVQSTVYLIQYLNCAGHKMTRNLRFHTRK
jgi:hypothetical protein